jgi:hypothetical protein
MQKRQTCMPTSLLYSLQQRGRSAHRPRRRPRRGVLPHHEQKDKSETDIARHIRDYTYDSGADEGRRLVGEGEEGEEGGFVALRG